MFSRAFASTYLVFRSRPLKPAIPRRNRRSRLPRSMGGKVKVKPQGFAGQYNLNDISVQVGQVRNGYWMVDYTRRTRLVVPSSAVGLCFGRKLANLNVWPRSRNISLWKQISIQCWLRKCSRWNFLPRTSSALQQARRRALPRSVLLGCAAIFGHEQDNGLHENPRGPSTVGREEMCVGRRWVSCTHSWRGRRSKRLEVSSSGEMEMCVGSNSLLLVCFGTRGFDTHGC